MIIRDTGRCHGDGDERRFEFLPVGLLSTCATEIVGVPPYRAGNEFAPLRARVPVLLGRARGWWADEGRRRGRRDLADFTARSLAYLGLVVGLVLAVRGLALGG